MSITDSSIGPFLFGGIKICNENSECANPVKPISITKMPESQNRTGQTNDPCCITHLGNELTNFPVTQTVIVYSPLSPTNCTPVEIPYNNLYPTYFIDRCLKRTTKTAQTIYVSIEKVCIPHQKVKCQSGSNCHRLHVCRDLWARLSVSNSWMAIEWLAAPTPKRDTSLAKETPLRFLISDNFGTKNIENDGECLGPEIDPMDEIDPSVHLPRELLQHIDGNHLGSVHSYFTPPPKPVMSNQSIKDKIVPPPPLIVKEMVSPAPPAPMITNHLVSNPKSSSAKAAATEMYNNLGKMWGKTQNETNVEKHIPVVQPYQPFSNSPKNDTNPLKFTNTTYSAITPTTISDTKLALVQPRNVVKEPPKPIKIIPVTKKKVEPEKTENKSIGKIGCFEKLSQLIEWKEKGLLCDAQFELAKKRILAEEGC